MTPDDILSIRASKFSLAKLAKLYGVSKSTVANIKAGRTHRDPSRCSACGRPYEQLARHLPEDAA